MAQSPRQHHTQDVPETRLFLEVYNCTWRHSKLLTPENYWIFSDRLPFSAIVCRSCKLLTTVWFLVHPLYIYCEIVQVSTNEKNRKLLSTNTFSQSHTRSSSVLDKQKAVSWTLPVISLIKTREVGTDWLRTRQTATVLMYSQRIWESGFECCWNLCIELKGMLSPWYCSSVCVACVWHLPIAAVGCL